MSAEIAKAVTTLDAASPPDNPAITMLSPIGRVTELADGTLVLHDITVTSETPDSDGEIIDYDSFKAVAPEFMKWATVGEMHDPDRWDAGTVLKLYLDDDARRASADLHVVDPTAVKKVRNKVYKAVSIHGEWRDRIPVKVAGRALHKIFLAFVDEISLCPRGANSDATFAKRFVVAKRDMDPNVGGGTNRDELRADDFAGKDRSYPIVTPGDVSDAASSIGRAGPDNYSSDELKARIIAIARRKGPPFEAELPQAWKEDTSMAKAAVAAPAAEPIPETVAKAEEPTEEKEPAFEGAKPPFGRNGKKKAARKAAKIAKANDPLEVAKIKLRNEQEIAKARKLVEKAAAPKVAKKGKGKLKPEEAHAAIDAAQATHDAHADGHDEGIADAHSAIDAAAGDDDGDEVAKSVALRAVKREKALVAKLAEARKVAKARGRQVRKMHRGSGIGRLTRTLAKAGARNSATDVAKIEGIHDLTVGLGYAKCVAKSEPVHDVAVPAPVTTAADPTVAKAAPPTALDFEAVLREAIPQIGAQAIAAIEANLGKRVSDLAGEVAKIANGGAGGGPLAGHGYVDPATRQFVPFDGATGPVAKQQALAAAADSLPEGDPLKAELGRAVAKADLLETTPWRR